MKITKAELKKIIKEELEQASEASITGRSGKKWEIPNWNDIKVGDSVVLKNNKKAKVVKLGGKGFPKNFVKVKPSSGKEEVVSIDDLKESNQVSEAGPFGGGGGNAREIMAMKKAKKEMQSVQSVISDMTIMLNNLYQKFKPTDEAAAKLPEGKLKSAKAKVWKAKRAIEAFSDSLYEQKELEQVTEDRFTDGKTPEELADMVESGADNILKHTKQLKSIASKGEKGNWNKAEQLVGTIRAIANVQLDRSVEKLKYPDKKLRP
jgi:hypothetical protein